MSKIDLKKEGKKEKGTTENKEKESTEERLQRLYTIIIKTLYVI